MSGGLNNKYFYSLSNFKVYMPVIMNQEQKENTIIHSKKVNHAVSGTMLAKKDTRSPEDITVKLLSNSITV